MAANDNPNPGTKSHGKSDLIRALSYFHRAHLAEPQNTQILLKMASCYLQLGDHVNAIKTIEQVLKIDIRNDQLYFQLGLLHSRLGNVDSATAGFRQAININPRQLDYYIRLADMYEKTNQYDKALELISMGLSQFPATPPLEILAARSEKQLGRAEDSLIRLERISSEEAKLSSGWRVQYNFELAYAHDRVGNTELAFRHFTIANDLTRSSSLFQKVDKTHSLDLIDGLAELDFKKINRIIAKSRNSAPSVQPVFFVGFPRSGTTLLQKVLDSHPDVNVIEEDNPLGRITSLIEEEPEKYLESGFLLEKRNIEKLRAMYFEEAREHVPIDDDALIVDKLPMNIVQIHIIKILFPDATILLGLRHPCDSILSCFMQNFGVNRAMASMFKFSSVIDYYDKTMGLWHIFKQNIDFESYDIRYEDLIDDMEGEVRKLLQFLDLPWDKEVLNFRQNALNRGLINTPSYSQVVKPIYKDARYRWLRYARHFEPYLDQLKPHCDEFGYSLQINDQNTSH